MRTILTDVYYFEELGQDARSAVLDNYRETLVEHYDWWDDVYSYWEGMLKEIGFINPKIFWGQGSGACFDASVVMEKVISYLMYCSHPHDYFFLNKGLIFAEHDLIEGEIRTINSMYEHEYTSMCGHEYIRQFNMFSYDVSNHVYMDDIMEAIEDAIEELRIDLCRKIYNSFEEEYEYLTNDETLFEYFNTSDYEFTDNGEMI
jgi:hypothetical protein